MKNQLSAFRAFLKNIGRGDRGQSLVEVAITLPLLLLLVMGGVEFSCLAYAAIEVSNAAKAAVQYGAQEVAFTTDTGGMQIAVNNEVTQVPGLAGATLQSATTSLACSDGTAYAISNCAGSSVIRTLAVQTTATFTPWATVNPLLKATSLPTSFTLTGYATQVVVQ